MIPAGLAAVCRRGYWRKRPRIALFAIALSPPALRRGSVAVDVELHELVREVVGVERAAALLDGAPQLGRGLGGRGGQGADRQAEARGLPRGRGRQRPRGNLCRRELGVLPRAAAKHQPNEPEEDRVRHRIVDPLCKRRWRRCWPAGTARRHGCPPRRGKKKSFFRKFNSCRSKSVSVLEFDSARNIFSLRTDRPIASTLPDALHLFSIPPRKLLEKIIVDLFFELPEAREKTAIRRDKIKRCHPSWRRFCHNSVRD